MFYTIASIRTVIIRLSLVFINLVGGIINARWLGPDGIGVFILLLLLPNLCFRFGSLGFGSSFAFFTAKAKAQLNTILGMAIAIGGIMSALSCLVVFSTWQSPLLPWHDIEPNLFYSSFCTIPFMFLINLLQRVLSGQLRISAMNFSEVIRSVSYTIILLLFVVVFHLGIYGALLAFIFSQICTIFYLLTRFRRSFRATSTMMRQQQYKGLFLELWRYGRWNYLTMLTQFMIDQSPVIFLKYHFSSACVGLFSVPRALLRKIELFTNSFSDVLFPYTAASKEKYAIKRTNFLCRNAFAVMSGLVLIIFFAAKPIIVFLYGEEFVDATEICYALLPGSFVLPIFRFLTVHMAASGNSKMAAYAGFSALPISLVSCYFLIPLYGAVGGALSISITYNILAVVSVYFYVKLSGSKISEVLLPSRSDLSYYKRLPGMLPWKIARRQTALM